MGDATAIFSIHDKKDYEIHEIVQQVYDALKEKGYNPVNQLVGYILSEDPTYITTYKGARSLIRKVDRDDLLQAMLRSYLNVWLPIRAVTLSALEPASTMVAWKSNSFSNRTSISWVEEPFCIPAISSPGCSLP